MSYSERIKKFREDRKLTHQQFANAVGVSRGSVQQWEKGVTAPKRKNQPAVAKYLGISVSELMASPPHDSQLADLSKDSNISPINIAQDAINNKASMAQLMAALGRVFETMDSSTRAIALAMITQLAEHPQDHVRLAAMIDLSIVSSRQKAA